MFIVIDLQYTMFRHLHAQRPQTVIQTLLKIIGCRNSSKVPARSTNLQICTPLCPPLPPTLSCLFPNQHCKNRVAHLSRCNKGVNKTKSIPPPIKPAKSALFNTRSPLTLSTDWRLLPLKLCPPEFSYFNCPRGADHGGGIAVA